MSLNEQDWAATYRPRLGAVLNHVVLLSYEFETPDVAAAFNDSRIAVEGAVGLVFEGHEPFALTWQQFAGSYDFGLSVSPWEVCGPFGLDQIRVGNNGDWSDVRGAALERVSLQTFADAPDGFVIGVGHHLKSDEGQRVVWVFNGTAESISPYDGLVVSLNAAPNTSIPLVEREVIQ